MTIHPPRFQSSLRGWTDDQWKTVQDIMLQRPGDALLALRAALAAGLPVDGHGPTAQTIFDLAAYRRCEPVALFLLDTPAVHTERESLLSAFAWSAAVTQRLLDLGCSVAAAQRLHGTDLFGELLPTAHPDAMRLLAAHGLDVNERGNLNGGNPVPGLVCAARGHGMLVDAGMVRALLDSGAAPYARDPYGYTFLHGAVNGHSHAARSEYDSGVYLDAFKQIVAAARDAGVDLDVTDLQGQSALHHAAKRGYANKAVALLRAGAQADLSDARGHTPRQAARAAKRADVENVLASWHAQAALTGALRVAAHGGAAAPPTNIRYGRGPR